ncbi:hypothetical protein [Noviherbaspirillum denitrificans]|uniref:DUF4434 domain-containing protein n=1 Tax=Noviherbaspirillum denitrificans TaxID=1968433 RepID=A0A254TEA6_9BURK|nr:hypothetical protein [Noviherbaspirillum denitrificans]OWW20999.1 hypothetical protein AYR66_17495 [Noviherbaspirillum denitrificans]
MRAAFIGIMFMMSGAQAAILQSCPDDQGGMRVTLGADGGAGCERVELNVPPEVIVALHPVAPELARDVGERLLLQGPEREGRFTIGSVTATGKERVSERPQPMPLRENLLASMNVRAFGIEERVRLRMEAGRLHLSCRAGTRPAGVTLSGPWTLPLARLSLHLAGTASARFDIAATDAMRAAKETSVPLGHTGPGRMAAELSLPRDDFDRANWRSFSIACPSSAAELTLDELSLNPQPAVPASRSMWVWDAREWMERPQAVLARAQERNVKTLFVSVPVSGEKVTEPHRLAAFIRSARTVGIAVWSVDGDPRMVLPAEHAKTVARALAYAAYTDGAEPDARLAGMQFDIEHYLLPGYAPSAAALDKHYLSLARALKRAAAGMPLEFVVPFWWAEKAELLKGLAASASGLNVMDYRTDPAQIRRFAAPFLDWGTVHRKSVRIALEAGPVEPELQRRYVRAAEGELWLVSVGQTPVLVLLKEAARNSHGPAFRMESASVFDGSATSFHRDPGRLLELLPSLEADFAAWPSFGGVSLHELK